MALTSDFDWAILLGVAALLLLGPNNGPLLRTVGRWYGRAMRLKQELLGELTRAAELPQPAPGQPVSLRAALLGIEETPSYFAGIPAAVSAPHANLPAPMTAAISAYPTPVWTSTVPFDWGAGGWSR